MQTLRNLCDNYTQIDWVRLLFIGDEQFNPECLHMLNIDFRNDDLFCVIFTLNKLHNTDLDHIRESTGVYTYISLNDIYGCCALILCQRDKNASALRAFADMLSRNLDVFSGGIYEGISGIASSAKEAVHLLEEHAICIDDVKGEDSRSKNSMLADCITAYIDQNIADANLSLTQVAQAFDISESQVSKIFRYEHNINFAKYIAMHRIELAKIYMREKHLSVTEVGQLVGYPSDHTFRRVFKKLENMTPSAYMEIVFKNSMLKEDKTC